MNPGAVATAQVAAKSYGTGSGSAASGGASPDEDEAREIKPAADAPMILPRQKMVKDFYEGKQCQMTVAGLIVINFTITCIQKEIDPQEAHHEKVWYALNMLFNVLFTIELLVNLYGRWWCLFWSSAWNVFDFTVVTVGIIDMAWTDMPGALRLIRLLRAFRVFRLFNRVESMRKVVESIIKAVPGVMNAFLINFILICIYAVLSVDFFSLLYKNCHDKDDFDGPLPMITGRGECWGSDYYGTFFKALYTMFQVLTGESWSEAAARPALAYYMDKEDVVFTIITYFFFYSFVICNSFVLLNVVVAVLMDGMNSAAPASDEAASDPQANPGTGSTSDSELTDLLRGIAEMQKQMQDQSARMDGLREELTNLKQIVRPNRS